MRLLSQESGAHRDELGKAILTLNASNRTGQDDPDTGAPVFGLDGAGDSGVATPASGATKLKLSFGGGGTSVMASEAEEGELGGS